jgi:hypothetical protein
VDCGNPKTTQQGCKRDGCCWAPNQNNLPWCFKAATIAATPVTKPTPTVDKATTATNKAKTARDSQKPKIYDAGTKGGKSAKPTNNNSPKKPKGSGKSGGKKGAKGKNLENFLRETFGDQMSSGQGAFGKKGGTEEILVKAVEMAR